MILANADVFDLSLLEEASIVRSNWSELVAIGQFVSAATVDAIWAISSWVDISTSWQSQAEIVTTANLNDATCWLQGDVSHGVIKLIAWGLPALKSLFNQTKLARIS